MKVYKLFFKLLKLILKGKGKYICITEYGNQWSDVNFVVPTDVAGRNEVMIF